jgi:protein-S-isoprenylcysteine O-methyltransferase Ste14
MHPALYGVLLILGWMPMLVRLPTGRSGGATLGDRFLLALTWMSCFVLTATSAWDASHPLAGAEARIVAGIALQWGAMSVWSWARASMGSSFAQIGPARELEMSGPYRRLRHPMYAATLVATFGMATAGGRVRDFVPWGLLGIVLALRAVLEEVEMQERFGARWSAYARGSLGVLPGTVRRLRMPGESRRVEDGEPRSP